MNMTWNQHNVFDWEKKKVLLKENCKFVLFYVVNVTSLSFLEVMFKPKLYSQLYNQ